MVTNIGMKNMKYKLLNTALAGLTLFVSSFANAVLIDIEYSFDGTDMTIISGPDLFSQSIAVGDVLTLTYTAEGSASYWDFSSVGNTFGTNLGFLSDSYATRSSQGAYEAKLDGVSILSNAYSVGGQSSVHLGPNYIDYSGVTFLDSFSISYEMLSSTNVNNNIGSYNGGANSWQIWDLFGLDQYNASFVYVEDAHTDVPEPSTLAIFALGMIGLATRRFRNKS
jgi:hypothetical protein